MSPTMTEGGIAGWKKNEGESFAAGDVLLEIVSQCVRSDCFGVGSWTPEITPGLLGERTEV